jgi:long-chain acyl-CoA synthetase
VESIYLRSLFVSQIFVDGNPLKDYIVAVVVPEQDYLIVYARANGIAGSFKQLCSNETIRNTIMNDLKVIGNKSGLMSYEKIRNIHLHHEPFTLENNLATPTLKLKRISLRQYFKDSIDKLYAENSAKTSKL